jgi:hypothetical protein
MEVEAGGRAAPKRAGGHTLRAQFCRCFSGRARFYRPLDFTALDFTALDFTDRSAVGNFRTGR